MKRNLASFLSLGIVALSTLTTVSNAAPNNDKLTIGITQEFDTMNPLISSMVASSYIRGMTNRELVIVDSEWAYVCQLCTKLPSLENGLAKIIDVKGVKKVSVDWELKPGLKWGDGKELTAKDFKLSWEVGMSPNVQVGSKETYDRVEQVILDPKNPMKFTTIYKEARYDFYQLTWQPLPSHIEGPVWEKTKNQVEAYEKQTKFTVAPTTLGLYNGPYVAAEVKLGSHVLLKPNPNFVGEKPKIKQIIIKLIPNTQTLEAALLSGTLDMISELGMTFDQAVSFQDRLAKDAANKNRYKVVFKDGLVYEHIDFNLRNPILADKRVRKAIMYSVDREKLSTALFAGKQKKAISNFHPLDIYYSDSATDYKVDLKKAGELFDQAGYKLSGDGIRYKDGKKLEINIMTTADNKTRELVEQYIQSELKKVGVVLTIKNEPGRVFFGETMKKGAFPGMAMYAWISSPDNPPRTTLHSKEIPTAANGWSGQNYLGFSNKEADEILEAVYREFDLGKRKELMAKLQRLYTEELPVMPLYLRAQIVVIPGNIKNFVMTGHQFYSSLYVEKWDLSDRAAH